MDSRDRYRYALSLTSQFPFCGLPLRLDTYSSCQFACRYCFASARGGSRTAAALQTSDAAAFARRLERVNSGAVRSAVDEFLRQRIPIHLGGMTDPFPPIESRLAITQNHLMAAKAFNQPVILSTKSKLVASEHIVRVLEGGAFAVQVSIGTIDDNFGKEIDKGASLPSERLEAMKIIAGHGIRVSCRIQPVFPGRESEVLEIIDACSAMGVKHVAVEHLKVPIEKHWPHRDSMNLALGFDVVALFRDRGAKRVGREWVLPIEDRLPAILRYRKAARLKGMSFGAADNDLLHFSDGQVCCSGADVLGLGNGYQYNYLEAIRRRDENRRITFSSLKSVWRPNRSISQYVNSRSRIAETSMGSYISENWSVNAHGSTPLSFFGVESLGDRDADGFERYHLTPYVHDLINS